MELHAFAPVHRRMASGPDGFGKSAAGKVDASALVSQITALDVRIATGVDGMGTALLSYPGMIGEITYSKITRSDRPSEIQGEGALDPARLSVGSSYFEISGRLRMDGRLLEERLLVKRQNREIVSLMRSRQALQPGLE